MSDAVDEELNRLSAVDLDAPSGLTSSDLRQPLEKLFSKKALSLDVDQSVGEAVSMMRDKEYGAICVTRNGKLVGIVTERDLVSRVYGVLSDPMGAKISEIMTADPVSLHQKDAIVYACHNLHVGGYRHLPVVNDDDRPVSIVSIKDVFRYVINFFEKDVNNLTNEPYRGPRKRHGA